jgi:hypothetical protein
VRVTILVRKTREQIIISRGSVRSSFCARRAHGTMRNAALVFSRLETHACLIASTACVSVYLKSIHCRVVVVAAEFRSKKAIATPHAPCTWCLPCV